MKRFIVFALVFGATVAGVACSSSKTSGNDAGAAPPGVGQTQSVNISAAAGGTVTVTGGSVNIPPGALAADTTITVAIKDKSQYAHADEVAVNVFDYGPNGTKFLKPVTMTIDLQGVAVPSGKTAMIAYYDGANWQTLPDSQVSGGGVTATTTHFTPFTIVFVGGQQTGGTCGSFTACGGSLVGTWTFTASCATFAPGALGPPFSTCPQSVVSATADVTGSVTFNADMTYSVNDTTSLQIKATLPNTCLDGGAAVCSGMVGGGGTLSDDGTTCTLNMSQNSPTNETGTYTTSGNTFTTMKDGGSDTPIQYCVSGTTLTAQQTDSKGNTVQYTATKQ
jgi:hypothetical protein